MTDGNFNLSDFIKNFQNDKGIGDMLHKLKAGMDAVNGISFEVTGEAGAGLVKVKISERAGVREVESLSIDPELFKEEKSIVEELVKAAVNDAERKAVGEREEIKKRSLLQATNQFFTQDEK